MPSVTIHNVISAEAGEPLRRLLQGKTYMNLQVGLCPVGGSLDVVVSTTDTGVTEEELRGMVMSVLAGHACNMGEPEMQRALAEGCDRLDDGDPEDRKVAARVERNMLMSYGLIRGQLNFYPKEEASSGYVGPTDLLGGVGHYVWIDGSGKWTGNREVSPGTQLYWDDECTVPLRKI